MTTPLTLAVVAAMFFGSVSGVLSGWTTPQSAAVRCVPVDSAWAHHVRLIDAATEQPIGDARVWNDSSSQSRWTELDGRACLRSLRAGVQQFEITRSGYQQAEVRVSGRPGQTVESEIVLHRVASPCCSLRGTWQVTLTMAMAARLHPTPTGNETTGTISLGPRVHRPIEGDFLDSLVHVERGLHTIDLRPFFGGPVARDVSTTVFGGGPDLYHEVRAEIPSGNSVLVTLIPRMSHGSISLRGTIEGDTVRGKWLHHAFSGGASGSFIMVRSTSHDTTGDGAVEPTPDVNLQRLRRGAPAAFVDAGRTPALRWSPTLGLSESGDLAYGVGGIFLSDSFGASWARVLGGDEDPVTGDDAGLGLAALAFVGRDTLIAGWDLRFYLPNAPHLYRSLDRGRTWHALNLPSPGRVRFLEAFESNLWLVQQMENEGWAHALFVSDDGGTTWSRRSFPARVSMPSHLFRVGDSEAFLASNGRDRSPTLMHTDDGGTSWRVIPAPADQGLQDASDLYERIRSIAVMGDSIVVQEQRRIFVSSRERIRWRKLPGWAHMAADPAREEIFVIDTVGRPALLDRSLNVVWRATESIDYDTVGSVMETYYRAGTGVVVGATGALVGVREGVLRVLVPMEFRPPMPRLNPNSREP